MARGVGEWKKGRTNFVLVQCSNKILGCIPDEVFRRVLRKRNAVGNIFYSICDSCAMGFGNETSDATIVVQRRANIPGLCSTWIPGPTVARLLVDEGFDSRGSKRSAVVIESPEES